MAKAYSPPPIIREAIEKYDKAKKHHDLFVKSYERRERSYRGVLNRFSDAAKWRHKVHPAFGFNLVETIVANTVEMNLRLLVRPAPKSNLDQQQAIALLDQVQAINDLLRHEHRVDEMDFKQRPFFLSSAIGGVGIGKCYWNYTEGAVRRQGVVMKDVIGPNDTVIGQVPTIQDIVEKGILRDHSTFEVVDPRDFIVHESARELQPMEPGGAQHLFHRCWYSFEQLKTWERSGFVKNVDMLKETLNFSEEYKNRETELWNINRTKDLIEVLEYWCYKDGAVYRTLIGNRMVVLRDEEESPFWHGGYPFVLTSSAPQLFSWRGMSDVELIEQMQEIMWEMLNQRLDNIELINNAIYLIRSDVDDPDAWEHYPGARWAVDGDPRTAVQTLQPPYQLSQLTLEAEALLKGDMQNITSASLFASGTQSSTIDQKTATGASLVMNAAQQHLASKKWQSQKGLRDEAMMRLKNCQQFVSQQRLIHVLGPSGQMSFRQLGPLEIQGDFVCELEPIGESLSRQERRAEASTVLQMMQSIFAQSYISGQPLDLHRVILWWARQWDIEDEAAAFFQPQQAPDPGLAALLMGHVPNVRLTGQLDPNQIAQAGTRVGIQPENNFGTTAGTAVNAQSPSATGGVSMSPAVMLQRALAMRGGAANIR